MMPVGPRPGKDAANHPVEDTVAIGNWRRRQKIRRLERRGDIVARWSDEAQTLLDLGEDLIPGDAWELSRDLYGLLVYLWAAEADRDAAFDAHEVLRGVRTRAWRGYTDMPALLQEVRASLSRGETGGRMSRSLKNSPRRNRPTCSCPWPPALTVIRPKPGRCRLARCESLDGLAERHADRHYGKLVRGMFAEGQHAPRDRELCSSSP